MNHKTTSGFPKIRIVFSNVKRISSSTSALCVAAPGLNSIYATPGGSKTNTATRINFSRSLSCIIVPYLCT